ncbi:MAG: hypothetical protein L0H53_04510 [Candidatus Nitrosocosmicus sp.]|nr:hypothetical protein [Candidatus Nitrosocosmicus sp.]MDN5866869.1 hypothetical protein [Candidatus Nitrosocosmicus sp.]
MTHELELNVKAQFIKPLETDMQLDFIAHGSNFEEIRNVSQNFVKDYIVFYQIMNVEKVKFTYGDKDGLLNNVIKSFTEL